MSFVLDAQITEAEYRGRKKGMTRGENPRPWVSLVFETDELETLEISVPQDLQAEMMEWGLERGARYRVPVHAVATNNYNYVQVSGMPVLLEEDLGMGEVY